MNYNNRLQTNNSSLEDIIDKLNGLPNAGEGGDAFGTPIPVDDMSLATEVGKIYLYTGVTNEYYTNGYLYVVEED